VSTSRPGLRRFIKRAGLVLCILLAAGWLTTQRRGVFVRVYPNHLAVSGGGIRYLRYPIAPRRPPEVRWMDEPLDNMHLLPHVVLSKKFLADGSQVGPDWWFDMPFWFLLLPVGVATLLAWRWDRPRPGQCPSCGYDLTGNESGFCPECGTEVKA